MTDRSTLAYLRHELRTPLNHIIGYGEMLLEDVAGSARNAYAQRLRDILSDARALLGGMNDFLAPAAAEGETVELPRVPDQLVAPLDRIVTTSEALKRSALDAGDEDLLPDLERICVAAGYLSDLVRHGITPPAARDGRSSAQAEDRLPVMADAAPDSASRGGILVVDDNERTREMLARRLTRAGYSNVATAADGHEALRMLKARKFDLVLLDVIMPGLEGYAVCERLRTQDATRDTPVIFLTALDDTFDKVRAFGAGAVDYVTKPFQPDELLARVSTHLSLLEARRALEEQNARLREEIAAHLRSKATIECLVDEIDSSHNFADIVGGSPALGRVLNELKLVAATDSTVLILGETGTGKELVARAIHRGSARRDRPLIKLNCATLPRDLVESELFGHEKGAFTGATQQRRGRFELADRGTLFLDEIGELPLEAQSKLLRVLQEQEFERVGGTRTLRVDVRVIAATNRDLRQLMESGNFRADLYYRLNVFPVALPPLRERREDIPHLVRHFMSRTGRKLGKRFDAIAPDFIERAMAYDWPGNIRELENFVERAAILSPEGTLEAQGVFSGATGVPARGAAASVVEASLADIERDHIRRVLEQTHWVIEGQQGAARILGLNASTLRGRMRKLGVHKTP
ncbi:MAG: sigma 54-interacting transcriptional regulator [Rhodospirillaceae bacterium]